MRELTDERPGLPADAGYITTVCCTEGKQTGRIKEEVENMQNVSTVIRHPVPIATAVASGLLAFAAGAVIALGAPAGGGGGQPRRARARGGGSAPPAPPRPPGLRSGRPPVWVSAARLEPSLPAT